MEKRLYRNEHDKVLAGVSSGLAAYMQVDVTIVRLLFVLSTIFLVGGGFIVYLVMWIVVPVNNDPTAKFSSFNQFYQQNTGSQSTFSGSSTDTPPNTAGQTKWNTENSTGQTFQQPDFTKFAPKPAIGNALVGAILLFAGIFALLNTLGLIPYFWFNVFSLRKLWPLVLIALGISLIIRNRRKNEWTSFNQNFGERPTEQSTDAAENKDNNPPAI